MDSVVLIAASKTHKPVETKSEASLCLSRSEVCKPDVLMTASKTHKPVDTKDEASLCLGSNKAGTCCSNYCI